MDATKFLSSTLPFQNPQVSSVPRLRKKPRKPFIVFMGAAASERGPRSNYGGDYGGNIVDENMILLRMRIQEHKMLERRNKTTSNWMEWEKKYYANNGYNEDVCEVLGFLQNYLINIRPALALGLIALVALSLIISTGVALFRAIKIAQAAQLMISSGFLFFS